MNFKLQDVCESVLYGQARAKMDAECAGAGGDCRSMMEDIADIVGERIKYDSEACKKVIESEKTLKGAYDAMRAVVEKRVKPERGKVVVGSMGKSEAAKIIFEYFGLSEAVEASKTVKTDGVKSLFDFLK